MSSIKVSIRSDFPHRNEDTASQCIQGKLSVHAIIEYQIMSCKKSAIKRQKY